MYLGVDYYPEHWDIAMIDEDIQKIKELGANIVRIGEFAWHLMEPEEGKYDFSFFDMVIEKLKENGLKVMFGTPTATFPAWLYKKYPEIALKDEKLQPAGFGGRREYCYNSYIYNEYSRKIVEKLVSRYGDEEAIISWQIDNELGHEGSDICYCENCQKQFQAFLRDRYDNIEELNKRYGTIFWGQSYNDFSEVPIPLKTITTHNPSLKLDWLRFRSYSLVNYAKKQYNLIKLLKGDHQTITTNLPGGFFDKCFIPEDLVEEMDFASYDNYPVWGGLKKPVHQSAIAASLDFVRGLKNQNFWIVEELMGAQGHNVIGYLPRPNQAKMWSYQAMAHGCESLMYFRYRGAIKGAEQYCYGILDQDNRKNRKYREASSFFNEISKYEELVKSEVKSDIAVIYDYDNVWSWKIQSQSSKFDFTKELLRLYRPFYELNCNIDVISINKPIENYKVLLIPVMTLVDDDFTKKVVKFVEDGGTVILSFRAGLKDKDNNIRFKQILPGYFAEISGIEIEETESLQLGQKIALKGVNDFDGEKADGTVWRDIIDCKTAKPLYVYDDLAYSGKAAITENSYKNGKVFYIGTGISSKHIKSIAKNIASENDIFYVEAPKGLEIYRRILDGKNYYFVNNHKEKEIGFKGKIFKPYESVILYEDFLRD